MVQAMWFKKRKKEESIGLVLGGGGARGWAHLGVLQAIDELDIKIDAVVGSSIGALVGGLFVAGELEPLREMALELDWKQVLYYFFDMTLPRSGLVDGKRIVDRIRKQVGEVDIPDLPIPFAAVATDIMTGDEVVLREGDLLNAIRASIAVPGIFTPNRIEDRVLVDGGLTNPLPVSVARTMGVTKIIAVDLNARLDDRHLMEVHTTSDEESETEQKTNGWQGSIKKHIDRAVTQMDRMRENVIQSWVKKDSLPNIFDVIGNTVVIMQAQVTEARLKTEAPDILIRPEVGTTAFMEFHKVQETMEKGYEAAMRSLKSEIFMIQDACCGID